VTQNATASQQLDLTLAKGCVIAVIKESDPMGNRDRWFIDNGGLFSSIAGGGPPRRRSGGCKNGGDKSKNQSIYQNVDLYLYVYIYMFIFI